MTGPVLVVTGASRGIGAATARLAAARGYDVCVNYQANGEAAEAVVAETILWLLSDQASYVTGAVLRVAGGR